MENRREFDVSVENARVWVLFEGHSVPECKEQIDTNHIHQYVEFFICHRGELHLELSKNDAEGQVATVTENDCVLIPIEYSHHLVSTSEDAEWYSFGFHIQSIKRRGTAALYENLAMLKKMDTPCVLHGERRFCDEIRRLCKGEHAKGSYLPALQITALLSELVKENRALMISCSSDTLWMKNGNSQFTVLEHIIAARYMEKLSYQSIAADLHVSERQLSRIIKKRYGMTLHKLITEKRLEAAKRMMHRGNDKIYQISEAVGFANAMSFRKAFFEKYGMTPSCYCEHISMKNSVADS